MVATTPSLFAEVDSPELHPMVRARLRDAERLVREARMRAFTPITPPDIIEWAREHVYFPPEASAHPGPFRTETAPILEEPLRAFASGAYQRIVLKWSTQTGKTTLQILAMLYAACVWGVPIAYATGNATAAASFKRERIDPMVESCEPMRAIKTGRKWDDKSMELYLQTTRIGFLGANSPMNLASRAFCVLLLDEIDKWAAEIRARGRVEGSAIQLIRKRADSFGDRAAEIDCSTPTEEHTGIDAEYEISDQREYHCPCPHCGAYQPLEFAAVSWEVPERFDPDDRVGKNLDDVQLAELAEHVRQTAHLVCKHCESHVDTSHKGLMLDRGVWVARGQHVRGVWPDHELVGDRAETGVAGFHASHLHSKFKTWGDVAAAFVLARGNPGRDFYNSDLGEAYSERGERFEVRAIQDAVARQLKQRRANQHPVARRGTLVPCDEACDHAPQLIFAIADVQDKVVKVRFDGWGARLSRWLIDWQTIECPQIPDFDSRTDLDAIDDNWRFFLEAMRQAFPVGDTGRSMPIMSLLIDSGARTHEVYGVCRRLNEEIREGFATPSKGFANLAGGQLYRVSTIDRDARGRRLKHGGIDLFEFHTNLNKHEAYRRLRVPPMRPKCVYWPDQVKSGDMHAYLRELCAEEVRLDPRTHRQVWHRRKGIAGQINDWWDLEVMGLAYAEFRNVAGLVPGGQGATQSARTKPKRRVRRQQIA